MPSANTSPTTAVRSTSISTSNVVKFRFMSLEPPSRRILKASGFEQGAVSDLQALGIDRRTVIDGADDGRMRYLVRDDGGCGPHHEHEKAATLHVFSASSARDLPSLKYLISARVKEEHGGRWPTSERTPPLRPALLISTPWALTVSASTTGSDDPSDEVLEATFSYDVDAIDGHAGKPYLFTDDSGETMYSASRLLKQQWLDAGAPGADEILERSEAVTTGGRTSGRSCTPLTQGSSITVPSMTGSVDGTVAKTTPTAAFIVQNGRTVSSTVLNNLATTWDQTVYPTATTYFGRNYNDGRGLAAPDVDNNCQVFVVIFDIDVSGAAGYFVPSFSNSRESILHRSPSGESSLLRCRSGT